MRSSRSTYAIRPPTLALSASRKEAAESNVSGKDCDAGATPRLSPKLELFGEGARGEMEAYGTVGFRMQELMDEGIRRRDHLLRRSVADDRAVADDIQVIGELQGLVPVLGDDN